MNRSLGRGRHVLLGATWIWLAACSLESDLPGRNGSTAPINSGVTLSGAGAQAVDASIAPGPGSRISDLDGSSSSSGRRSSADAMPAGIDKGGAVGESTGEVGGSASSSGGTAGVGGRAARAGSSGHAESAGAAGAAVKEPPPALWFSEYIEGSSSNKALEITTLKRAILDGCKVSTYFNGKTEATVVATLSGTLEAGQVLTVCTSSLKDKLADVCNQVGNLIFNGDDVVSLSCDGVILDVIGQIGVDPGEAWGADTNTTADHTLRRQCTVQFGDADGSDAFEPSAQWHPLPVDTFDGLGTRGCSTAP